MFQKKQIFKLSILKQLLSDENACVSLVPTTRLLALPPFFLNDMKSGILYLLNCMLKKYDRSLGGIVIGYQNIKVLMDENTGIIPMGASETEINISVEFYIFQPKVGSFLEGVVNKKSSNHIGCLVHQYFNATILKPEDVNFDEWICRDFNVNDKIVFRVKELDFTSLLPRIEGVVFGEDVLSKNSSGKDRDCEINDVDNSDKNKVWPSNKFLIRLSKSEQSDSELIENKNKGNAIEEIQSQSTEVNAVVKLNDSSESKVQKKKKNQKFSVSADVDSDGKGGEKSGEIKVILGCDLELKENETFDNVKKKKMNKKKQRENNSQESFNGTDGIEKERKCDYPERETSQKKYVKLEDKKSCIFLTPFKVKKEKKKKKNNELLNTTSECLPLPSEEENQSEDNVFCSTQLEPGFESKMEISFCSPIPRGLSYFQKKEDEREERTSDMSESSQVDVGKEKKKKHMKRKREEGDEELMRASKKMKASASCSQDEDFEIDKMVNQRRVSKVMEGLDASGGDSFKRKKSAKREKDSSKELNDTKTGPEGQTETSKTKDSNASDREEIKKKETPKKKTNGGNQNPEKLVKEKKKKTDKNNSKEKKKSKSAEASPEESVDSLYKKLLRDAINAINTEEDSLKKTTSIKEHKSSDTCRKKKKSKDKEKATRPTDQLPEESFKNGSMYDITYSPEKINSEKSLFTDSEQSHSSPVKKWNLVNGLTASLIVQSHSSQQDGTKKESEKNTKKSKKNPKESLYEKLLKQAKEWIDIKEETSFEKSEKTKRDSKVQKIEKQTQPSE